MYNFIHIPKVAGSSLFELVGGAIPVNYCGHVRAVDVPFFCFVRNPYDRLVSAYAYLIKGGGNVEPDLSYQRILQNYADFTDFVLHIEQDKLLDEIIHIKPMSYFTCDDNGNLIVRPFKIEEPEKIDEFLNSIGVGNLSDIKINVSEKDTSYLNAESIAEINRLYKKDFEIFGYELQRT